MIILIIKLFSGIFSLQSLVSSNWNEKEFLSGRKFVKNFLFPFDCFMCFILIFTVIILIYDLHVPFPMFILFRLLYFCFYIVYRFVRNHVCYFSLSTLLFLFLSVFIAISFLIFKTLSMKVFSFIFVGTFPNRFQSSERLSDFIFHSLRQYFRLSFGTIFRGCVILYFIVESRF